MAQECLFQCEHWKFGFLVDIGACGGIGLCPVYGVAFDETLNLKGLALKKVKAVLIGAAVELTHKVRFAKESVGFAREAPKRAERNRLRCAPVDGADEVIDEDRLAVLVCYRLAVAVGSDLAHDLVGASDFI